jgi:hypothetical protein
MSSMFDYDDSINLAFDAKIAGKSLVAAKHELLTKTGDFLFLAHTDRELAFRMQMVEQDIEKVAYRKLANISDSKAKLVRTIHEEWQIRHASCEFCKGPNEPNKWFFPNKDYEDDKGNERHEQAEWDNPHAKPNGKPYVKPDKDPKINYNGMDPNEYNKIDHTKFTSNPNENK